jgi:hypothetical protein
VKVLLREHSGGTQSASFDDHNLGLSRWSSSWSLPAGLGSHHQHSAFDFILRQAAQLSGDLDLTLEPVCQTLRGCNGLVETRRIVACTPMAPRGRYGLLAVHRSSPTSNKQTSEEVICAMHNCRRLGPWMVTIWCAGQRCLGIGSSALFSGMPRRFSRASTEC